MRAPWMTDWPTPPHPMTATVEPGCTFAVLQRGTDAGRDAAPDEGELLVRQVGLDLHEHRLVRRHDVGRTCRARSCRTRCEPSCACPRGGHHRLGRPLTQVRLVVQAVEAVAARRDERGDDVSPDRDAAAPRRRPRARLPAPSWPRMIGSGIGTPPLATVRSEWQTPLASICTRTSCGPSAGDLEVLDDERLVVGVQYGCPHGPPLCRFRWRLPA